MTYLNIINELNAVLTSKKLHLVWQTRHLLMNLHLVCQLAKKIIINIKSKWHYFVKKLAKLRYFFKNSLYFHLFLLNIYR